MSIWTSADTFQKAEILKSVWEDGNTASEVSKKVSKIAGHVVSRNAIIGVLERRRSEMGNMKLKPAPPKRGWSAVTLRAPRKPAVRGVNGPEPKLGRPPKPLSVPLTALEKNQCKWPVNDVPRMGVFLFCGHPTDNHSYCSHHRLRNVTVGTKSERTAHRVNPQRHEPRVNY